LVRCTGVFFLYTKFQAPNSKWQRSPCRGQKPSVPLMVISLYKSVLKVFNRRGAEAQGHLLAVSLRHCGE